MTRPGATDDFAFTTLQLDRRESAGDGTLRLPYAALVPDAAPCPISPRSTL